MEKHPDERLDVVNENNEVVAQATRQEVHDRQWLHRAVHLILTDGNGFFLLQERAHSRPTYPGRWDSSAAGHVPVGLDFDETIRQEAQEEIGFTLADPVPLLQLEGSSETDFEWIQLYVERLDSKPSLKADPGEVKSLRWWNERELVEALLSERDRFSPVFVVLFFLWRQTGFLAPERQKANWYSIASGETARLHVQRAFLEGAGFRAKVSDDQHWAGPARTGFFAGSRKGAHQPVLSVPREELPEAVALLYLSHPADEEEEEDRI